MGGKLKSRGVAQLPIIVALLILSVALPAAVNLVQKQTRVEKQAYIPPEPTATPTPCPSCGGSPCCPPKECFYPPGSPNPECGNPPADTPTSRPPTNTPSPIKTPTPPRTPTSTPTRAPIPTATPTSGGGPGVPPAATNTPTPTSCPKPVVGLMGPGLMGDNGVCVSNANTFLIETSGTASCYPHDVRFVIKADANQDGIPDIPGLDEGNLDGSGEWINDVITHTRGAFSKEFTLPSGNYVWRGWAKAKDNTWSEDQDWVRFEICKECTEAPEINLTVELDPDSGSASCSSDKRPTWKWQTVKGNTPACTITLNKLYRNWAQNWEGEWRDWVNNQFTPQQDLSTNNVPHCVRIHQGNQADETYSESVCVTIDTTPPRASINSECRIITLDEPEIGEYFGCATFNNQLCYYWDEYKVHAFCVSERVADVRGGGSVLHYYALDGLGNQSEIKSCIRPTPTATITPTPTPTPVCPLTCQEVKTDYPVNGPGRNSGDADCNRKVELNDFVIWISQYVYKPTDPLRRTADFDCNPDVPATQGVGRSDFTVWISHYAH